MHKDGYSLEEVPYRVGQSREIWTTPRHRTGRLPSYPTAALAASARRVIFPKHRCVPGRTRSGASAVPKHDSRSGTRGTIQWRADGAKYIWYFATHNHNCYQ